MPKEFLGAAAPLDVLEKALQALFVPGASKFYFLWLPGGQNHGLPLHQKAAQAALETLAGAHLRRSGRMTSQHSYELRDREWLL